MEGNQNKIMHILQCEGTLTPPGLTMSSQFEDWFLDWSLEHDYCLITFQDMKECRLHIPPPVLYKAKCVFAHQGREMYQYRGINWMKKVEEVTEYENSGDIIDFILDDYDVFYLYSHDCLERDKSLQSKLNTLNGSKVFEIGEWKDTVLYMKRNVWEETNA